MNPNLNSPSFIWKPTVCTPILSSSKATSIEFSWSKSRRGSGSGSGSFRWKTPEGRHAERAYSCCVAPFLFITDRSLQLPVLLRHCLTFLGPIRAHAVASQPCPFLPEAFLIWGLRSLRKYLFMFIEIINFF